MAVDTEGPVKITLTPDVARFNLRIRSADLAAVTKVLGIEIPALIEQCNENGTRSALCLGPDEWVLFADSEEASDIEAAFSDIYSDVPHSLTNISDREITIGIDGDRAAEILSVACPRNLDAVDIGTGFRTIFNGVQVVIHRDAVDVFRLDCWRSFFPHVRGLLTIANRELSIGL